LFVLYRSRFTHPRSPFFPYTTLFRSNMEEMGGLLRRMPQTGAFFLIGSLAISAMPPFNGFVSEWLTFQSLLLSFEVPERFFNLVDRKSTRLNSSHQIISYAFFCLKKK